MSVDMLIKEIKNVKDENLLNNLYAYYKFLISNPKYQSNIAVSSKGNLYKLKTGDYENMAYLDINNLTEYADVIDNSKEAENDYKNGNYTTGIKDLENIISND
jgi:hypothetical protein